MALQETYQTFFLKIGRYSIHHTTFLFTIAAIGVLMLVLIRRKERNKVRLQKIKNTPENKPSSQVITSQDIKAIAGDDVIATQMDLARAYIEMGKKTLAKKILDHVIAHGTDEQKNDARHITKQL